jgi:hypothetical protein
MKGCGISNLDVSFFGVLFLSSLENRRQILSHLETILDYMQFLRSGQKYGPLMLSNYQKATDTWNPQLLL